MKFLGEYTATPSDGDICREMAGTTFGGSVRN